ncbi:MAG: selenocysteine lyase/cysteine desulfurase [Saprospiraceae bacterium]|jgi:selenocysteine lyase/cysteine desulfurase
MKKRSFLKTMAGAVVIPNFYDQLDRWQILLEHDNVHSVAQNEEYWAVVRSGYRLKPDYINLENGYYCIVPQETLEKYIDHARHVNYQGSYYMRTVQLDNKHRAAARLAKLIGAQENEVILTRNTTESLDTIIGGYPWQEGDEAIYAQQDYGAMRIMFELQERRHGIKSKIVSVPNHPSSDKEIVALYESAITDRTKLLMVCHIINITGHIMPIRKICDMAHARGVDVMVDGAHAIGHFDFDIKDLNCDYYGSSLHKWLSVPLGSGLLYVKEGMATKIWPTFAEWNKEDHDILKLNHTGTHPPHTDLAVNDAIDYLSRIGPKRKEERLRYIQRYWTDQVRDIDGINVNTPRELHRSCGIANVGIEGIAPSILAKRLMSEFNIWTVAINQPPVIGCRITPNIYTSLEELDTFVAALKTMAAE